MCYSLESSIKTTTISLISIVYLLTSNIPKFKWLGITLIGWCSMQAAEAVLWYTQPDKSCTKLNKFITMTFIPIILIMQGLGSLYGSLYVNPWSTLSKNYKLFFIVYTILMISIIVYSQYGNIKSMCTTVTRNGHLNWGTSKSSKVMSHTPIILSMVVILGIPLLVLWKNKLELIIYFLVPFLGALYSLTTDSPGSVWCYYTSFSSVIFAFMLLLHTVAKV